MGIQRLGMDDYPALTVLWAGSGLSWDFGDDRASFQAAIITNGQHYWGYEWHGKLIGCVLAAFDGRRGWIYHLAVDPEFRRRGIGRLLMSAAEHSLYNAGCPKVNLLVERHNIAVMAFYEALGYHRADNCFMEKPLVPLIPG
ncbi:MAG: GNAT family N-acetyltransferase [Sulfobacillus sp.]